MNETKESVLAAWSEYSNLPENEYRYRQEYDVLSDFHQEFVDLMTLERESGQLDVFMDVYKIPNLPFHDFMFNEWLSANVRDEALRAKLVRDFIPDQDDIPIRAIWSYSLTPQAVQALVRRFGSNEIETAADLIERNLTCFKQPTEQSQEMHRFIYGLVGPPAFYLTTEDEVDDLATLLKELYGEEFVAQHLDGWYPDFMEEGDIEF